MQEGGRLMDDLEKKIIDLQLKIVEVKKRFPYHSVQPYLINELEALEEQLEELYTPNDIRKLISEE